MPLELDAAIDSLAPDVQSGQPLAANDPLDDAIERVTASGPKPALNTSLNAALDVKPEQFAEAKALGAEVGVPADVAHRNMDEVRKRADMRFFDALARDNPVLAKHLENADFAKLAHDDHQSLTSIEQLFREQGFAAAQAELTRRRQLANAPRSREGVAEATLAPEATPTNITRGLIDSFFQGLTRTRAGLESQIADILNFPELRREAAIRREDVDREVLFTRPEMTSKTAQGLYSGGESLLQQLPGLALSIGTASPVPALAMAGLQTEAEAYGRYRGRGATAGQAALGAIGEGGVEVATELLPMKFLVDKLGRAGAGQFLSGLLARELPGEQAATIVQDALDTAIANPDKTWADYLAERPDAAYQTALATLVQTGAIGAVHAAAQQIQPRQRAAREAAQTGQVLQQLQTLAQASALAQRDPGSFQAFVDAAAQEGPVRDIYVDGAVFAQSMEKAGVTADQLAQAAPVAAGQLGEALATGGSIRIPVGEYTAKLAPTDLGNALLPHLKTDPNGMSQDEAKVFMQGAAEDLKAQAEAVLAEKPAQDAFVQSAQKVEQIFRDQLELTSRFTLDVNNAYASLMSAFYTTMAQRLGTTPEELYQRYPLEVRSTALENAARTMEQPAWPALAEVAQQHQNGVLSDKEFVDQVDYLIDDGLAPQTLTDFSDDKDFLAEAVKAAQEQKRGTEFAQSAAKAPRAKAFKKWFGKSKVVDEDGNPMVVYHGTTADFTEFERERGNVESDFGAGFYFTNTPEDVEANYAGIGPDLEQKIQLEAERIAGETNREYDDPEVVAEARAKWVKNEGLTMPVFIRMENPAVVGGENQTVLQMEQEYDDNGDPTGDESGTLVDFILALRSNAERYHDGSVEEAIDKLLEKAGYESIGLEEAIETIKGVESFGYYTDENGRLVSSEIIRESLEDVGFDGVIDQSVDKKFGSQRRVGKSMVGMHGGTTHYIAFKSEQIKSAIGNRGTFDPNDPNILNQATGNRAQIALANDIKTAPSVITLLKHADLSSFLHESGHFFLEVLTDIAAQPNPPQQITDDLNTFFKHVGVKDLAEWQSLDTEARRPRHEQFARSFEAYLFEGKAPNVEMQGLFARFRAWLLNVYQQLKNLRVNLSDEVRGVFDRMLATDEQIKQTEAMQNMAIPFKAEEVGMDPQQWAAYQEEAKAATQAGLDELQTRGLKDMQWLRNARGRELRKLQTEAAGKRKAVRKEALAEVRKQPIYAALRFLTRGELGDTVLPEGVHVGKLSLPAMKAMYGESTVAPWRNLTTGKFGVAASEGLHPDTVAQLFGFTSGDHLVRSILDAPPERVATEALTDQRMLERYGDLSSPKGLERAADQAVHNAARAKFVTTGINALHQALGQRKILSKAAKQFAEAIVARKRIRDIRPAQHSAAEAKAAREVATAKDLAEKAAKMRAQLVQHYATTAAYDARDEVDRGVRFLRKFNSEGTRKNISDDYLEQIDAMLERFDLGKVGPQEAAKRTALAKWIEAQRAAGYEPLIDDKLADEAFRTPYESMTLEQFRGLVDAVRNIDHLGRLKQTLLTAKEQREFKAAAEALAKAIKENAKRKLPESRISERGALVDAKRMFKSFLADHRKFASLMREFDGLEDDGTAWNTLVRGMNEAGDFEAVGREKATVKLGELLAPILKEGKLGEKTFFRSSGKSFTREERLGIALNMGNDTNRERVLTGEKLSPGQLQEILDTLTKEEWDFVQGVWDFIDSYWKDIAAKQKRLTGVEPQKVDAAPVQTKFGEYRGGYYPIAYDPLLSERSHADTAAEVQKQLERGLYTAAQTRRGHTKERTESTGRPLRYDLSVITKHVDQVVHDLAWHEWLVDANRLLRNGGVESAIRDHYGNEVLRTLKDMLTDIAVGDLGAQKAYERVLDGLRKGATIVGLGWRLSTALLQPLGLTQSISRIGAKWVAKGAKHWMRDTAGFENSARKIAEKSDFMRLRAKTLQREISEIRNKVRGKDSKLEASYFWMIQKMQLVADIPTWWGAYEKAMSKPNMTEDKAIALADQAVKDAQGSGQVQDLAAVQRGSSAWKLFTNFYSFFNTTYNLTSEAFGRARSVRDLPMLAADLALLYTIPAMFGTIIKAVLSGDWEDEKKFTRQLVADQLNYMLGTVVVLREAGAAIRGALHLTGADYTGPASLRFFSALSSLAKQAQQGEADEAFWKSLNQVAGIIFHYPAGQVQMTAEGALALAEGKTENPGALVVGPPK